MRKLFTLFLSLCAMGTVAATAGNKPTLGKHFPHNTASIVSVPGMNARTPLTYQAQKAGLQGRPSMAARKVGNEQVDTIQTPGFGWLVGPDGNQWYYTQTMTTKSMANGWGGTNLYYATATITVYDSNNKQQGQFTVEVPDTMRCNSIEPYGAVTKKLFDKNDKNYEVPVTMHGVGDYSNGYVGTYATRAYHIDGSGIAYELEGSPMLFDASHGWNSYQRLVNPVSITEVRDNADGTKDTVDVIRVDVIAPPGWSSNEPTVEHTFKIDFDKYNYMYSSYISCYDINEKPYYVIAQYEKEYAQNNDDPYSDIIPTENNSFILTTYDKNFKQVDSLSIPIKIPEDALYRFAAFGSMSDNDLSDGYFGPAGEFSYVVSWVDYVTSSDSYTYDFEVYNNKGVKQKTVCTDASENQWFYLSDIKGKSQQMAFLRELGNSSQEIRLVDVPACTVANTFSATIDTVTISSSLDRIASTKNDLGYQYVISAQNGDVDANNNVIAKLLWVNPDQTVDHITRINLGEQGEYFTPLINSASLNPYLFDTDEEMEYIYIAKKRRTDGTNKIDNVLEVVKEDGTVLKSWRGDDNYVFRTASVVSMNDVKTQLLVGFYSDDENQYRLSFYDLPFNKFAQGGDGSAANPYLIASAGDLKQMASEPSKAYKLVADIDLNSDNNYWTPVEEFSGSFDGNGHTICHLAINSSESSVGLFAELSDKAKVSDLTLVSPSVTLNSANQYVGTLAGTTMQNEISNVRVYGGSISGAADAQIGGIVGQGALYTTLSGCYYDGEINAPNATSGVGGIAGDTRTSSPVNACAVNLTAKAGSTLGGIVGTTGTGSTVSDCHATVNLEANHTVGGIVGENSSRARISRSVSEGTLAATKASWNGLATGGIVGKLESNWSSSAKDTAIIACVANVSLPAADAKATVHQIVGYTIANEAESTSNEHGIFNNYSLTTTYADAESIEGAKVETADKAFFEGLGYKYGDTVSTPWKDNGKALPVVFFEKGQAVMSLSTDVLHMIVDTDTTIVATAYGVAYDDIDATSADESIATVELGDNVGDNAITLHIKGVKCGQTTITVTAAGVTTTLTVYVNEYSAINAAKVNTTAIKGVYTLGGQYVGSALNATSLAKGVYVVVGGNGKATKIVVK